MVRLVVVGQKVLLVLEIVQLLLSLVMVTLVDRIYATQLC
jgi:hypothetical protein